MRPELLFRRDFLRFLSASIAAPAFRPLAGAVARSNSTFPFSEISAAASGIDFVHTSGKSAQKYLPESTGSGCAFLDYDNDGWMDIYLVNSGPCDFWTPSKPLRNALYRNNRDGTFTDVTEKAGVAAPGWASSAVWFDYDNDGRLDLFVCRFVDFSKLKHHVCNAPNIPALAGINEYCYPRIFDPMPSWLFHNNGDGTFTDVSQQMGIASNPGKAWGVVATDINNDSFLDLFVANDTTANFIFANRGGKRFEEI